MLSTAEQEAIVDQISRSARYQGLCRATIESCVAHAGADGGPPRVVEQAARKRLHAVKSDYLLAATPARVATRLRRAMADTGDVAAVCRQALAMHRSSAERRTEPDRFYRELLDLAGGAAEVADLACAMGPFLVPLTGAAGTFHYRGVDLNRFYVDLPGQVLGDQLGPALGGAMEHRDVSVNPDEVVTDVALFLKTLHCAESRRRGLGLGIVAGVRARCVVVSLPTSNFAGKPLPTDDYLRQLEGLAADRGWELVRRLVDDELVVAVHKQSSG